jgi:hypothetical protein
LTIPSVNSRESTKDKIKEVEHIISALGVRDWIPVAKRDQLEASRGGDCRQTHESDAGGSEGTGCPGSPNRRCVADALRARNAASPGFEEIQRFVDQHGSAPQHGEDRDIFERLYAVRLDRLRALEECRSLLASLDRQGLLAEVESAAAPPVETMGDDELLAELEGAVGAADITELRHVRASADKRAAEEIANREKCENFEQFKPLFDRIAKELETGMRITRRIRKDAGFLKADIREGEFFVLGGQTAYVAEVGEPIKAPNGELDARLRVIYSNATESNLLLRSLQRALYKDETSRRVSEPTAGPLFADEADDDDLASGTIYVLRSKSDHPVVAAHRDVLHKIGVTGGNVPRRIANAKLDPTFLMADVEIVATYELYNINRAKLN